MSDGIGIWNYPEGGAVPDLADLLQAMRVEEMYPLAQGMAQAWAVAVEAEAERATEDLREAAEDLKAKGVAIDVGRMLRPSLWERAQDAWDGLFDRRRDRGTEEAVSVPMDQIFAFEVTLASAHARRNLSLEHNDYEAAIERMVDALRRQISAQRGRQPLSVTMPDDVYDDLVETDDWTDNADLVERAGHVVAYWPPHGQPALALSVLWEDPELPVEVVLQAHAAPAHRRFVDEFTALGGSIG